MAVGRKVKTVAGFTSIHPVACDPRQPTLSARLAVVMALDHSKSNIVTMSKMFLGTKFH